MRAPAARLLGDRRGATLVEFTVVIGFLFAITFSIVEGAMLFWQYNTAEKATHLGVRYAVESDAVANFQSFDAIDEGFVAGTSLTTDEIAAFTVRCEWTGGQAACTCAAGTCTVGGHDFAQPVDGDQTKANDAFDAILAEVQRTLGRAQRENLVVEYAHVGLGFAGRPTIQLVPMVTVRLRDLTWDFTAIAAFGGPDSVTMPSFTATLGGEDLNTSSPS